MDFEIENEFRPYLSHEERILWCGKPKTGIRFRSSDYFFIPFSFLWLGFAVFWVYNAFSIGGYFAFFGIPFILIGLYMVFGRFFYDAILRKKTRYAITENRILILSGLITREIKSLNIQTLSDISFTEKANGSGSISLGPNQSRNFMYGDFNNIKPLNQSEPGIEFIDEVRKVYNILIEQQNR